MLQVCLFDGTESSETSEVFRVLTSVDIFLCFSYLKLGVKFYKVDPKLQASRISLRKKKEGKTVIHLQSIPITKGNKNKIKFAAS